MRSIARRVATVVAVVMLSMIMLPTRAFALIDINHASHGPVNPQYLVGSPSAAKPKPYLEYNGRTLEEGVDYTLHWEDNTAPGTGSIWVHGEGPFTASMQIEFEILSGSPVPIYRMYNTKTSEHLYTTNVKEYNSCGTGAYKDWNAESTAWFAPEPTYPGAKPVYRLYNTKSGDHHYTTAVGRRTSCWPRATGTTRASRSTRVATSGSTDCTTASSSAASITTPRATSKLTRSLRTAGGTTRASVSTLPSSKYVMGAPRGARLYVGG